MHSRTLGNSLPMEIHCNKSRNPLQLLIKYTIFVTVCSYIIEIVLYVSLSVIMFPEDIYQELGICTYKLHVDSAMYVCACVCVCTYVCCYACIELSGSIAL